MDYRCPTECVEGCAATCHESHVPESFQLHDVDACRKLAEQASAEHWAKVCEIMGIKTS